MRIAIREAAAMLPFMTGLAGAAAVDVTLVAILYAIAAMEKQVGGRPG
jgi:hypothetical protein